jgi:hypothetical protein
MRAVWRRDKALHSPAQWRGKLGKNNKQGTSAPTLAAVWAGPVDLMGALQHQPEFEGLRLTHIAVRRSRRSTSSQDLATTTSSCTANCPTASAWSFASRWLTAPFTPATHR